MRRLADDARAALLASVKLHGVWPADVLAGGAAGLPAAKGLDAEVSDAVKVAVQKIQDLGPGVLRSLCLTRNMRWLPIM